MERSEIVKMQENKVIALLKSKYAGFYADLLVKCKPCIKEILEGEAQDKLTTIATENVDVEYNTPPFLVSVDSAKEIIKGLEVDMIILDELTPE